MSVLNNPLSAPLEASLEAKLLQRLSSNFFFILAKQHEQVNDSCNT